MTRRTLVGAAHVAAGLLVLVLLWGALDRVGASLDSLSAAIDQLVETATLNGQLRYKVCSTEPGGYQDARGIWRCGKAPRRVRDALDGGRVTLDSLAVPHTAVEHVGCVTIDAERTDPRTLATIDLTKWRRCP